MDYVLNYDNGHDRGELEFSSDCRLNSKGNMVDARNALRHAYGQHSNSYLITNIAKC